MILESRSCGHRQVVVVAPALRAFFACRSDHGEVRDIPGAKSNRTPAPWWSVTELAAM